MNFSSDSIKDTSKKTKERVCIQRAMRRDEAGVRDNFDTLYQCSTKLYGQSGLSDFQKHVGLNTIDGLLVAIYFVFRFREWLEEEEDNLKKDLLVSRYWFIGWRNPHCISLCILHRNYDSRKKCLKSPSNLRRVRWAYPITRCSRNECILNRHFYLLKVNLRTFLTTNYYSKSHRNKFIHPSTMLEAFWFSVK